MRHDEYVRHDAVGIARLVRDGEVSPREVLDCALARIDAVNPKINAVIHRFDERARAQADGPLPEGPFRGVPFLVKDLDGVPRAGRSWSTGQNATQRGRQPGSPGSRALICAHKCPPALIAKAPSAPEIIVKRPCAWRHRH